MILIIVVSSAISILLSSLKLAEHFLETTTLVGAQAILLNFSLSKKKKNTDGEEKQQSTHILWLK